MPTKRKPASRNLARRRPATKKPARRRSGRARVAWSGIGRPGDDLSTRRADGYYDVIHGVDGWVVSTPTSRWVHDGTRWVEGPKEPPLRGIPGAVSREDARRLAESLIAKKRQARRNPSTGGCAALLARSPIAALRLAEGALATVRDRAHPRDQDDLSAVLRSIRAGIRELEAIRDQARSVID